MDTLSIPTKPLSLKAHIPENAYRGDAGYDLQASESLVLAPFERALIGTGLSMAIPMGYAGFVVPRSGLAIKQGLSVVNAPGLIDSNYRGEIKVIAINLDPNNHIEINIGDRIAQLVIMKVEQVAFEKVEELETSQRGEGGFGSSGV
ncbi:MAG: dUTP diphosphatase [Eggerthellaceae bacterium]